MYKKINFRGQDHSPVVEDHVNRQLSKIEAFLAKEPLPVSLDIMIELHQNHVHHSVKLHIKSPHYQCHVAREGQDIYAVINDAIDNVYEQLRKQKDRLVGLHKQKK